MHLLYEKKGHVAILTMNRPECLNALSISLLQEMEHAWIEFRDDKDLWVAILTGAGDKAFSAGADLKEIAQLSQEERKRTIRPGGIHKGLKVWKPIIAAVNGLALGGGTELALACDIRIASQKAVFGLTEVSLGVIPAGGGTQRLPRLIPLSKAMEMILAAKRINAQEAWELGLVSRVVAPMDLMDEALTLAQKICEHAPLAVRAAKRAIMEGLDLSLEEGLRLESELVRALRETEDAIEGPRAFAEKRKPKFQGK